MTGTLPKILGIALLFFSAQLTFAAATDWSNGRVAFDNGNYESALQYFIATRSDGLDSAAVHYNIAVCQFKLERFDAAGDSFQSVADRFPKMRGLAEYNLGLVARRQHDSSKATQHFLNAYRLSPDDKTLRILSSNRLRELEPEMRSASKWTGAIGMRAGYDDNVALRDEAGLPATLTTESSVADFFATVKGPYVSNRGMRVAAGLYVVRNFDADDFNQTEISGGIMYDWRPGDWRLQVGAHLGASSLGGDAFDRKNGVSLRAVRYLDKKSSFNLSYAYDDVQEADAIFAGIAGSRQQLQAMYRWYSDGHQFSLRYRQEDNERLDPGVSPKRKTTIVDYRYRPENGWGWEAEARFRRSQYESLPVLRREDLLTLNARISRSFGTDWLMLLELQVSRNNSSDAVFSYDRNLLTIGAMKIF